ncbi:MAG: excinuclease ABC subunit UvrA [Saprospiraceae bacterium]|nr:excinuclease ABC subunit UvrA [Saprospiraceae bacterium]HQV65461.1 excinuclease ABC subunit UvrA [Saprospiraceae bacterium]HQV97746.1 excinuclease ABC subunit UvrA [Saprospiraceae bacterium]
MVATAHSDIIESANKSDLRKFIHIKGARSNNLKNIELFIPKNKLVVVTGVSGSGKSSLIIDTLYAEGQRRYVESLSSYARQFLDRMKKPEVDYIKGICPAIAIEQKVSSSNARSTVGSLTEIYDYMRLLYARVGKTFSPITGNQVRKHDVTDVVDYIFSLVVDSKVLLLIPLQRRHDRTIGQELDLLMQKGYSRVYFDSELTNIEDLLQNTQIDFEKSVLESKYKINILIDRFVVNDDDDNRKRVADSVQVAFNESEGECLVSLTDRSTQYFNNRFELDGLIFIEPTHQLFNYNNPFGACPKCEGYGKMLGIDPEKIIPDENLSIYQEAIACWRGEKGKLWWQQLIQHADEFDFPIHKPYKDLSDEHKELLWSGNTYFEGLDAFFQELEDGSYKIQNRVMLSRYRGKTICNACKGGRLRKEATYVQVGNKNITQLINLPIDELLPFFETLTLSEHDEKIAQRILTEIKNRLKTMIEIGLGYLTIDRLASTLSGGETQRINLTRTLGSNLTNSLYILDEPSVGLHPKDTEKLVLVLKRLRDLGNTVVVIEHEEAVIRNADYIVDIGPHAGVHGGDLVFAGDYNTFIQLGIENLTASYLTGDRKINYPEQKRKIIQKILVQGARQHNLKNVDVTIPLQAMTVVTGVSGSGKTSLVKHILYPAMKLAINDPLAITPGRHGGISGDIRNIKMVEMINQSPIGKSSRSNPVTYVKAYDDIRKLYSDQQASKIKGFEPKHFSFNVEGGRCETCKGEGHLTVEMQFLADVTLVCEECQGQRFKKEVLEVTYQDKNIFDVLNMTIEESLEFFKNKKSVLSRLQPLADVGLGYIKLGQSSSTLSGGEAQRVKLASFLTKEFESKNILFIFDEPTTGLHFHDINKLMDAFTSLVENGHTVLIVEHNMDVIRAADWVIDLGPTGGKDGGHLLFEGRPQDLKNIKNSFTGQYI